MSLREAAEKALEALEITSRFVDVYYPNTPAHGLDWGKRYLPEAEEAINALRTALAEADEPVAWRTEAARWLRRQANDAELESFRTGWANPARHMPSILRRMAKKLDAEQEDAPCGWDGYQKGKEYPPSQEPAFAVRAEAEEPVAWAGYNLDRMADSFARVIDAYDDKNRQFQSPLVLDADLALREFRRLIPSMKAYTHPPRREPLTEEEVRRLYREAWTPESEANEVLAFARAIERAHGIGGES